jgi:tRNA U34 5-carboxymethylaminomethyl modifying enzyme MnmG/GidA
VSNNQIIIKWCSVCETWYIECPRCGNNTCNGAYGESGKCPVCPDIYSLQDAMDVNTDTRSLITKLIEPIKSTSVASAHGIASQNGDWNIK